MFKYEYLFENISTKNNLLSSDVVSDTPSGEHTFEVMLSPEVVRIADFFGAMVRQ
jgi:hypothetical protein